ncbi:hypothetical protein EDB80DRAFT_690403 [Ilyonectria destructans]|nr:hypothetical protein EDB80DRAFT_690403 [Ilyonectria destructans]
MARLSRGRHQREYLVYESQKSHLADLETDLPSPYPTNLTLARDISAYGDANFNASHNSPERQPCLGVLDGQRLSSIDITEPGTITVDALSGEESGDAAQSPLDSPSPVDISHPRTVNPAEATETLLQDSKVSLRIQRCRVPSLGGYIRIVSRNPSIYSASGPTPPRRSRRKVPRAHELVQDEDSNASSESSGSEKGFDGLDLLRDGDYCPSLSEGQGQVRRRQF